VVGQVSRGGAPAPGEAVQLWQVLGSPDERPLRLAAASVTERADDQGFFWFVDVAPGHYILGAGAPSARWWPGVSDPQQATPLEVGASILRQDLELLP
jgi:hypothetical protein